MSVEIPISGGLGAGRVMIVDADREEGFRKHSWRLYCGVYAQATINGKSVKAHHFALRGTEYEGCFEEVHHLDNNGLNNQRSNLFPIKKGSVAGRKLQTTVQKSHTDSSSKYRGVDWRKDRGKWRAQYINLDNKKVHIGYFDSEEEAGAAYQEKASEIIKILEEQCRMEWFDFDVPA